MLASRASLVSRARFVARRRTFATTSTLRVDTPSEKVCVVPFAQSWPDARDRLYTHGLLASASWANVLYAAGITMFGSAVETLGKELGLGSSLNMRSMKAAYYPVWRIDAIAENGPEGKDGWLAVREGYIPGNPFAPLSYLSYAVPPLNEDLPTYDRKRDLNQIPGHDIVEVPFTVDPIRFVDKVRERIGRTEIDGVAIDANKWKEVMLAAYPVYFPLYLAEFEVTAGEDKRSFTMVMDAHDEASNHCRISFPPPGEMRESSERLQRNYYVNPAPFLPTANLMLPVMSRPLAATPEQSMGTAYSEWMSPKAVGDAMPASPTFTVAHDNPEVNWSDPRIQRWTGAEREQNGEFMEKAVDVASTLHAMRAMRDMADGAEGTATVFRPSGTSQMPLSEYQDELAGEAKKLTRDLENTKPDWLRDYEREKREEPEKLAESIGKKDE